MAKDFYMIRKGKDGFKGRVETWAHCKRLTSGPGGHQYKGFHKGEEELADAYLNAPEPGTLVIPDNEIVVYTDGSVTGMDIQPAIGSWAYVVMLGDKIIDQDAGIIKDPVAMKHRNETSELKAAMMAVMWARKNQKIIRIGHDYLGIRKYYTREDVARHATAKGYVAYMDRHAPTWVYEFIHTKGHTGITGNELADTLAGEKLDEYRVK